MIALPYVGGQRREAKSCMREGCSNSYGAGELKACRGCGEVFYCSRVCQEADWPTHKRECRSHMAAKDEKPAPCAAPEPCPAEEVR